MVNGRSGETVIQAVTRLQEQRISAVGKVFDVTKEAEISQSVLEIETEMGPIEILVNNAGIQRRVPLLEANLDVWEEVLSTDLTAPFLVARSVAERMKERRRG
ncbi:MAG: SDR family NAD(P)-dependent oxidoreductase, partial [Erythrobacter cryptus]